jgi:uncharacterized protein YecT (DUF1311 family)
MLLRAGLTALALLVAVPVQADTAYDACANKAASNVDYSDCGTAWIAREEARLNARWKSLYAGLPVASKRDVLTEQRAWIAYKDKSCLWRANGDWGREGQVIFYPTCRAKVIADRADYLTMVKKDMDGR